jgi:putrescine transport system substrate-binding protein
MLRLLASLLLLTPLLTVAQESAPAVERPDAVIRVYNWNDYIAPQVLKDF